MNTSQKMFILAAQEMNFSRAAEKAFVTPQCLSDHIKRLEEHYRVQLFVRRPHLQLTPEGQAMLRCFLRIQALEDSMKNELADISGGVRGTVRLGVPATRGAILIPRAVAEYHRAYPHVEVQVSLNDTRRLAEELLEGQLDLFLGVGADQHPLFHRQPLYSEPLYLVISRSLLERCFGEETDAVEREFREKGADLTRLQQVEFVLGHSSSTTTDAVQQFLLQKGIQPRVPIRVSNFDIHMELCRGGGYGAICARAALRRLMAGQEEPIRVFPLRDCPRRLEVELITHRDARPLEYMTAFARGLAAAALREDGEITRWLEEAR
ncbi:MAG: LysR family transcriptional regulator [Oscillospiraceae bacterium]|nr:LysR family transcriptional regulator [Oscillospiraceae bacterium]